MWTFLKELGKKSSRSNSLKANFEILILLKTQSENKVKDWTHAFFERLKENKWESSLTVFERKIKFC